MIYANECFRDFHGIERDPSEMVFVEKTSENVLIDDLFSYLYKHDIITRPDDSPYFRWSNRKYCKNRSLARDMFETGDISDAKSDEEVEERREFLVL